MSFGEVRRANSNTDNDETTELIIAVVALITSVLALVISLLQALQQYSLRRRASHLAAKPQ
jgi:hypothetical protein